jgi:radical SAM protein with 4Fe4S-binding SPASM domain
MVKAEGDLSSPQLYYYQEISMSILEKKPQITNKIIRKEIDAKTLLIDSEKPSWVTVSKSMADLICKLDGSKTIKEIVKDTSNKVKKDVSHKLISGFKKLYKIGIIDNDNHNVSNQSQTLDQVYFNLTKKCNLRCVYCYAKADMTNKLQEMPLKFWNDIVLQLKQLNPKASICFTGGEALLFKGFWELAESIRYNGLGLSLITNGTVSNPKDALRFKSLFQNIKISLDSLDENTNSITRGAGSLRTAKKFIDALITESVKPTIMVVVTKANAKQIAFFKTFFENKAIITYQPLYVMGRALNDDSLGLTADEYYNALEATKIDKMKGDSEIKRNRKLLWCGMGRNVLSIESDGKVYPCQLLHNEELKLGDLNYEDINTIWSKSPYRKNSVDDIEECCTCEIKHLCGAPCRARAYFVTGNIFKKDPLCPDFIKRSHIGNMIKS